MTRPTFMKKVKGDNLMLGLGLSLVIFIIVFGIVILLEEVEVSELYILFLIVFVDVVGLFLRSSRINSIYDNGVIENATVIKVNRRGRYSSITVEYRYDNELITKRINLNQFVVKKFREDEQLELVVDQSRPKRILIKRMFDEV